MTEYSSAFSLAGIPGLPRSAKGVRELAKRLGARSRPRPGRGGGREFAVSDLVPAASVRAASKPRLKLYLDGRFSIVRREAAR